MTLAPALEMAVRTDPGILRSHNEDAVHADAGLGIAILADGMGGYNAGEVASGMATTRLAGDLAQVISGGLARNGGGICDALKVEQHLVDVVETANFSIFDAAQREPLYAGMGTTLVLAWFYDNRMSVAHVGDSRLYRLRGESFEQLTRDHSLLQEQIDNGMISPEEARYSAHRNLVTRALGVDPVVEVEISDYELAAGDIVMLCSDGLTDMIDDPEMALALQTLGGNLQLAADHLVQMANDHGGRDNISVILVKVVGDFASPRGWWQRLLAHLK